MNYCVSVWYDMKKDDEKGNPMFSRIYYRCYATKSMMDEDFEIQFKNYRIEDGFVVTQSMPS